MKHSSANSTSGLLYLEPYTFSVSAGNDVLIYNSLSGIILEYRNSPVIAALIRQAEDAGSGFLAVIGPENESPEVRTLISDIRESFSGDLLPVQSGKRPSVIRPKPVIKNYPPPKDFPSFSADDYLRNIYLFLNEGNDRLSCEYRYAAQQFNCLAYHEDGYREMPFDLAFSSCLPFSGFTGVSVDLSGSDLTAYSEFSSMTRQIRKLMMKVTFHIPLPCQDESNLLKALATPASRTSLYITFPGGLDALSLLRNNPAFAKHQKKTDLHFLIRSIEEYEAITAFLQAGAMEKVFLVPYYTGCNFEFFRDNVFLGRNDILGLKPDQKQIFSRSLINEHTYGKLYIKASGEAFANLNHQSIGNIRIESLSNLVRHELYNDKSWSLTRMKAEPCRSCLYQLFCPPISNYEILMNRFNFCDVL